MELAISLLIIGIIMGAVISARDLISSAQTKEFYQSFVGKWISVVNIYYDKSGSNLTDSTQNGGSENVLDGYFDGIDSFDSTKESELIEILMQSGINLCESIDSNVYDLSGSCGEDVNPFKYKIGGEFADIFDVVVGFKKYILNQKPKNFILFINIAGDVASSIDRIVDGKSNGKIGKCLAIAKSDTELFTNDTIPSPADDTMTPIDYLEIEAGNIFIIAIEVDY